MTRGEEAPDRIPRVPLHVQDLYQRATRHCNSEKDQSSIQGLLRNYQDVFSTGGRDMGSTDLVRHEIPTQAGVRLIRQPARQLGPAKEADVERQVQDLADRGLIFPSSSAWSSPVVFVKRKDNKWRFCIDYRCLNAVTEQDAYPLRRIDESLDALAGSKFFSTLDLLSG